MKPRRPAVRRLPVPARIRRLRPGRVRAWRQWTLRSRMMVSIAALAAVALIFTDVAGMVLLHRYLNARVDAQLRGQARGQTRSSGLSGEATNPRPRLGSAFGPDSRLYRYRADGTPVPLGDGTEQGGPRLGTFAELKAHAARAKPYTVDGTGASWRVLVAALPNGQGYAVSAVSLREVEATEGRLLTVDIAVTVLALVLIGAAAASVVRVGLRPLTRMGALAEEIAGGNLSLRVTHADPHTESGRLGAALNTMLVRIEAAVADSTASELRLRQFLADASHELRTPLTSIQGFAELYRRGGAPPGPELDEAMGRIEGEVGRMRLLVNDLLLLARLDEERPLEHRPVDLLAVAADAIRDAHVRVPDRFVHLSGLDDSCDTFEPVTVLGDEARIRQVATNLVANALQHTPDDAAVVVRVGRPASGNSVGEPTTASGPCLRDDQPVAVLEVADTGPGMSVGDADRAFERLYRADPSRSRRHGGAGLGLSIVAAIVQAHEGRVELWTTLGSGTRFRVLLPAQPPPDDADDWSEHPTV